MSTGVNQNRTSEGLDYLEDGSKRINTIKLYSSKCKGFRYQYFYKKLGSNQLKTTAVISCTLTVKPKYVAVKNVNVVLA